MRYLIVLLFLTGCASAAENDAAFHRAMEEILLKDAADARKK